MTVRREHVAPPVPDGRPEGQKLDERPEAQTIEPSPAEVPAIELRGVTRAFALGGGRLVALQGIDLVVGQGELVAILGPNGSGKSTLLRVMAGLLPPDEGSVVAHGTSVEGPSDRVGLVFQEPRLLPWRDTISNVAFPLELLGIPRDERESQARAALELVGLGAFEGAFPAHCRVGWHRKPLSHGRSSGVLRCCCSTSRSARSMRSPVSAWTWRSRRSGSVGR